MAEGMQDSRGGGGGVLERVLRGGLFSEVTLELGRMGEKEPGKGCSQQDQKRQQRPWGGNKSGFQEAQGGIEVSKEGCGRRGVGKQGAWVTAVPQLLGEEWGCQ